MKKPREIDCRKLCENFNTCTLTECGRRKGSINNSIKTVMLSEKVATYLKFLWDVREYREMGDITDNGNNFRKKII